MRSRPNQTIQRMGASRLAQLRFGGPGRLAPTADGRRWRGRPSLTERRIMNHKPMRRITLPLLACLFVPAFRPASSASDIWVQFSELTNGAIYHLSNTFTSGGITCQIEPFQWSSGQWTSNGSVRVQSGTLSVGSAPPYLWLGNANVRFDFGMATDIRLQYGAFGGNQNLRVNGTMTNFTAMGRLNGITLGTVSLCLKPASNGRGELQLSGIITNFAIGGQEFAIDDVCISPYAGPKFRAITLGPSNRVSMVFSYPGTDASRLALKFTGALQPNPQWLVDSGAAIASTAENWFAATTVRLPGTTQGFYLIEQSAP